RPEWPAAFENVIAVGAAGQPPSTTDWLQTDFSNFGGWVDCCAPGVGIVSTFVTRPGEGFASGYAAWTGTSMAAPAVAGTIAALASNVGLAQAVLDVTGLPTLGAIGAFVDPGQLL
ncbi:MAG TPA: S8 family serine peptidase, partial [Candidatus Polarisedimenticolaceae bacterium]|nr:S8 family serine peptidase [Candidatus Polarisedimenticolaceae bacterium]